MNKTSLFNNDVYYEKSESYYTATREINSNEFLIENISVDDEILINKMIEEDKRNGLKVIISNF